jgi:hypothetical protein
MERMMGLEGSRKLREIAKTLRNRDEGATMKYPTTPDGRYFVHKERLWRCTNPKLDPETRQRLVMELMTARRDVAPQSDPATKSPSTKPAKKSTPLRLPSVNGAQLGGRMTPTTTAALSKTHRTPTGGYPTTANFPTSQPIAPPPAIPTQSPDGLRHAVTHNRSFTYGV